MARIDNPGLSAVLIVWVIWALTLPVWVALVAGFRGAEAAAQVFVWSLAFLVLALSGPSVYFHFNTMLDGSPPSREVFVVTEKLERSGKTLGKMQVHWPSRQQGLIMAVPTVMHETLGPGKKFEAMVHPGAFGIRWISEYLVDGVPAEQSSVGRSAGAGESIAAALWRFAPPTIMLLGVCWFLHGVRLRRRITQAEWVKADLAFRSYSLDTQDERYSFAGGTAQVLKEEEEVRWFNDTRLINYTLTRTIRNSSGEYFLFIYRLHEEPYVKHIEQRIAKVKLQARYLPPEAAAASTD